jgi:hypothetical protein
MAQTMDLINTAIVRFEFFMALTIQLMIFWLLVLCNVVVVLQCNNPENHEFYLQLLFETLVQHSKYLVKYKEK